MRGARREFVGVFLLVVMVLLAVAAPAIGPNDAVTQLPDLAYAPPMPPRLVDAEGRWHAPFVYSLRLVDRLERRYVEDRSVRVPLRWFEGGVIASTGDARIPWLPLGADALGRDVLARVLRGGRLSLGIAAVAVVGALCLGALIGAAAGSSGGRTDDVLMRAADFVLVLPAIYVVLALRASMPLVLTTAQVFWSVSGVLALAGWPYPARVVRAVIAAERQKEYAEAAKAAGAGRVRILLRHLFPATHGVLVAQATLLLPAFILAEATLSFVGLGFLEPVPSWGVMLQEAARAGSLADAPWLLAPAAAIAITVLAVQLAVPDGGPDARSRASL